MKWEVRTNCEYAIEVEAEGEEAALDQALAIDLEGWSQAWAPPEAEPIVEVAP